MGLSVLIQFIILLLKYKQFKYLYNNMYTDILNETYLGKSNKFELLYTTKMFELN